MHLNYTQDSWTRTEFVITEISSLQTVHMQCPKSAEREPHTNAFKLIIYSERNADLRGALWPTPQLHKEES